MRKLGGLARVRSVEEIRTRAAQEIWKRSDLVRHLLGLRFESAEQKSGPFSARASCFFFSRDDVPRISAALRRHLPEQSRQIVSNAEGICRREFDLLSFEKLNFGDPINWHFDPVHKKRAPRLIWYKVPYLDTGKIGDSKIIWELNRHQHLVMLAKAYCLTGESRFVQEILDQWGNWQRENPYPLGINWSSSLEVGFRSLSWLWVWHLLEGSGAGSGSFKEQLWRSLSLHGRHIEVYLSTYSSPNTHLLGEAVAMFFLGVLCPELRRAAIWRDKGWRIIKEESRRQVLSDGAHFEQSTYYHTYALDFFLHARILAARNGIEVPAEFDDTLKRMLEWLAGVGQCGIAPRFGDDDGGRVFDGRRNRGEHLLDPLSTGAVLFRRSDWRAIVGAIREETIWLLGPQAVSGYENLTGVEPRVSSRRYAESGTYVMAEDDGHRQQLTVDAGRQGAFSAGHGHADALSVHLSIDGREWLADPGTYSYLPGADNREAFRCTAAHNTLLVDRLDQAISAGAFGWKALPQVAATSWVSTEKFEFWEGQHTGYCRLPSPVVHKRSVFHLRPGFWIFHDWALGEGLHQLDTAWHFGPEITVKPETANGCVGADPNGAQLALVIAGEGSGCVERGWYSAAYGSKEPAFVFRYSQTAALPSAIATLIFPNPAKLGQLGTLERVEASGRQSGVYSYRYIAQATTHQWVFANGDEPWRVGSLASDARVAYCRVLEGRLDCLLLSGGTFFRFDQKVLFEAPEAATAYEWEANSASSSDLSLADDSQPIRNSLVRSRE